MRLLLFLLMMTLCYPLRADSPPKKAISPSVLARLIEQLGDRAYSTREEASRALSEIGEPALEALRRARTSTDPEVRRRATLLVRRIEQQADMRRILSPTKLRLTCKELPLPEAVELLAKKAGVAIQLQGNREELAKTTITLDTGETTFWKALEQLCAKAGLVETSPPQAAEKQPAKGGAMVIIGGGAPRPKDLLKNPTEEASKPLLLAVGKSRLEVMDVVGSVRVRVLSTDAKLPGKPRGDGEYLLGIEATMEPRSIWKGVLGLRITKAIDDQGQSLANLTTLDLPENQKRNTSTIIINSVPITGKSSAHEGIPGPIALRLRRGEKPAKSLKEVAGTLVALVQTPHETLVRMDDILKATGKTVKIAQGGHVKVVEVAHKDGEVRLKLNVEAPPTSLDDGVKPPINATIIINGEEVGKRKNALGAKSFTLLDGKGKPFTIAKATDTGVRVGQASEVELIFQANDKQGTPTSFLYQGRRTALVEVPFTLRNVTLP
jgi:hypothetical protein